MQAAANDFQEKFNAVVKEISLKSLPLQKKVLQASVQCYDKFEKSGDDAADKVSDCVAKKQNVGHAYAEKVQAEVQGLQDGIQSCQQTCYNKLRGAYGDAKSEDARTKIQGQMEACTAQCFKDFSPTLQQMKTRLLGAISEGMKDV
uniref:Uncharacterized protein n=1 Tax=Chromera velia CCMP2878 TaxID=1169474 RepID=A0A0G4GY25_9ALVE|mmetsp:Transcript_9629/g.18720  ORF Transcript_9629/g.18720 Transcript_9629/m.18720 type:complete len:146 (-) Transcript_9629:320-757(-)|eukprot:Cvel_780.t1-p1 / transcript=Cvel_780.t1 / gene=Cvel_780 / organism=Chromera_velia_CCMP2878 / gene_product=Uncharacterized protein ZK637.2, putative / transcript_product=Uncharacterized protein ZK637.2, putative / location=Cvel_scaffold24:88269-90152(+) / protein_length=145 / sequence_SO=supercontig / SO=protein_coding / is_pseudo=false